MLKEYGTVADTLAFGKEAVCIRFFDGPLDLAWRHCGLTSDFLGPVVAGFAAQKRSEASEIESSVSYLVNEILENAVKFRSSGTVTVTSRFENDEFRLQVTNLAEMKTVLRFQEALDDLLDRNPSELLIERIEKNAADPEATTSGLGLLTLMSDYGVEFGWRFVHDDEGGASSVRVETQAVLPLR